MTSDINIPKFREPTRYFINDNLLIPPIEDTSGVSIIKGPNIKDVPLKTPLLETIEAVVLIKLKDNITTDDIMPAGSQILPLRSNIPAISEYVFFGIDNTFSQRAREAKSFIIIGGENYGQGSSREHAAIAPMYLGLQAVIVKSFARIHRANLINFGILPLVFENASDYDRVDKEDKLLIKDVRGSFKNGHLRVENLTKGSSFDTQCSLNKREAEVILAGGLLPYTRGITPLLLKSDMLV